MANQTFRQTNLSLVVAEGAKQQTAKGAPLSDALLNIRHKCTISETNIEDKKTFFDCENKFVDDIEIIRGRKQFSFVYNAVAPEILAFWAAYYFGATAAPTGSAANEVQTLTSSGTGGTFKLSVTLEGRTGITAPIAFDATAVDIKAALTKKVLQLKTFLKMVI